MLEEQPGEKKIPLALTSADNDQVVVIKDGSSDEKPGALSWEAIGHYLNQFKYWVLGAVLLGLVLGYVGVKFIYNPSNATFTSDFRIDLKQSGTPGKNVTQFTLINGDKIDFRNIISGANIKKTIDNSQAEGSAIKGKYDALDAENLETQNLLYLEPTGATGTNNTVTYSNSEFTIGGKLSSLGNDADLAGDFVKDLIKTFIDSAQSSYTVPSYLSDFYEVGPFDYYSLQIGLLQTETATLTSNYASLMDAFGSSPAIEVNGTAKTLLQYYTAYASNSIIGDDSGSQIISLKNTLNTTGYVYIPSGTEDLGPYISHYQQKLNSLQAQISLIDAQIAQLQLAAYYANDGTDLGTQTYQNYQRQITALGYTRSSLQTEAAQAQKMVDNLNNNTYQAPESFVKTIADTCNYLADQNAILTTISRSLVFSGNSYTMSSQGDITVSNGFSSALGALLGGLVAFAIATFVVSVKGQYDRKRALALTGADPVKTYAIKEDVVAQTTGAVVTSKPVAAKETPDAAKEKPAKTGQDGKKPTDKKTD